MSLLKEFQSLLDEPEDGPLISEPLWYLLALGPHATESIQVGSTEPERLVVAPRKCDARVDSFEFLEPLRHRTAKWLERVGPAVLAEPAHALRLLRPGRVAVIDHQRPIPGLEQRDHRIAADAYPRHRAGDWSPAGKVEDAVLTAHRVQDHQRAVQPAADAVDLPLGQCVHVRQGPVRLGIDDRELERQCFERAVHGDDFAGLARLRPEGRRAPTH